MRKRLIAWGLVLILAIADSGIVYAVEDEDLEAVVIEAEKKNDIEEECVGQPQYEAELSLKSGNNYFNWDGSVASNFSGGTGTELDPYIISTAPELAYFMQTVNTGTTYYGKYVVLTTDIYLNDVSDYENWSDDVAPQNVWEGITGFAGTLDGQSHTIFGLYRVGSTNVGFFNEMNQSKKAVIKNLNFENSYVSGRDSVGIIAGKADYITIENCSVNGKVFGISNYAGGFIGKSGSGGNMGTYIINCANKASVSGGQYVGGFIGYTRIGNSSGYGTSGNGSEKIILKDCKNIGEIEGKSYVAGIVGYISRSMNCGGIELTRLSNENTVYGTGSNIGGICGYFAGEYYTTILNECFNSAKILGTSYVGGIVGTAYMSWETMTIKNIYNLGEISGSSYVGGILGKGEASTCGTVQVISSYNTGTVTGTNKSCAIIGYANCVGWTSSYVKAINSYYLSGTTSASTGGTATNVKAYNMQQMTESQNYSGFDFESVWRMGRNYPVFLWENNADERENFEYDSTIDNYIIEEVKKYTSDQEYAQYKAIMTANTTDEEKFRRLNELFTNLGITDIHEGTKYISEVSSYRSNYLYMTTNDIYCAYNFWNWLYSPAGTIPRGLLYADGLIFNGEALAYTNLSTYTESDYPGVKKNKAMLKQFMEMSDKNAVCDVFDYSNKTAKYLSNILKLNALQTTDEMDALMNQIINCSSEKTLEKLQKTFVEGYIMPQLEANGTNKVYLEGDQFGKALGYSSKVLSFAGATADDIVALLNLSNDIAIYQKYSRFLTTIYENTDVSFEMRLAAYLLLDDISNGYYNKVISLLTNCIEAGVDAMYIDKSMLQTYLEKEGVGSAGNLLSDALATLKLGVFISNIVVDTGDFVKQAAYTQGYAELSAMYSLKLEEDKKAFQEDSSTENAWTFFEDYTVLWNLRYQGEQQYLRMNEIKMYLFASVKTFNYNLKEEVVKDTLKRLETCKFEVAPNFTIPVSAQYVKKAVIQCPVNVEVYTMDGELITVLKDGEESDTVNEWGHFAVVYQPYSREYAKVICQSTGDDLVFKCSAVADGLVDYIATDQNIEVSFDKLKVAMGNVIEITGESYSVDYENDGIKDISVQMIEKDKESYVPIKSADVEQEQIDLCIGESLTVGIIITPDTATNTVIDWMSLDEDVATVKNGVVTGVGEGETTILAKVIDSAEICLEIPVRVTKIEKGDINFDKKVDLKDVMLCLNHVSKKSLLEGTAYEAADIDEDGTVSLKDLMRILNYVSKKSSTL